MNLLRCIGGTILRNARATKAKRERNYILKTSKSLLAQNKPLNDSKSGRCFIIGNGPSFNDVDPSLLAGEDIFVVNFFANHKNFASFTPKYYVIVDPFIMSDEADSARKETILKLAANNPEILAFIPFNAHGISLASTLEKLCQVYYLRPYQRIENYMGGRPELDKPIPNFGNVVLYCAFIALAMGYKEIALLGCDETGIFTAANAQLGIVDDSAYAYPLSEHEKQQIIEVLTKLPFDETLSIFAWTFRDFRLISQYAKTLNANLYNCSKNSMVKTIDYKPLPEILK